LNAVNEILYPRIIVSHPIKPYKISISTVLTQTRQVVVFAIWVIKVQNIEFLLGDAMIIDGFHRFILLISYPKSLPFSKRFLNMPLPQPVIIGNAMLYAVVHRRSGIGPYPTGIQPANRRATRRF